MSPPDFQLSSLKPKEGSLRRGSSYSMHDTNLDRHPYSDDPTQSRPNTRKQRFIDSFRRDPSSVLFPSDHLGHLESRSRYHEGARYYDLQLATLETAHSGLARKLKGRHLQMIAIGGSIGSGLFVASGRALAAGGPASLLIAFFIVGTMLYCTCQALGELAVAFPVAGSFSSWAARFLDPSWGFAMGWNYAMQWLVILPLELIAASLTIAYWDDSPPSAVFVSVFLITIFVINMFGVEGYGEAEFIFSIIKVIAVIGFILLGIVLDVGGTPEGGYIGGSRWLDPGSFNNGFKGLCSVFVTAAFSFTGTELVGLAAAETANPRKSLPTSIKQVFWRITLFYIVALTLVGLLVPYNNPHLLDADFKSDAKASPFVIAIEEAGIAVLPSIMNAVILVAVLSVGNSAVFGSSRTLAALANLNQAPKILAYVDRRGRPLVAIFVAFAVGLLAFLADLRQQGIVFDWLLAVSGLSSIFTWTSICMAHIRFRQAWKSRGHSAQELPFRSPVGVLGSYVGIILNIGVLAAQFWVGAFPIGWRDRKPSEIAESFFLRWMGAPIFLLSYLMHKIWFRTSFVKVKDMDVDTGRRDFNLPILVAQEKAEMASWPKWKRFYKYLC